MYRVIQKRSQEKSWKSSRGSYLFIVIAREIFGAMEFEFDVVAHLVKTLSAIPAMMS